MAIIEANSETMQASIEQAVEGILGKIANSDFSHITLEHARGTQNSLTLKTVPRTLTYTFHPSTPNERIFRQIGHANAMWTVHHVDSGERARKPTIEELAHSVITEETRGTIELKTIIDAALTVKQMAKFIVLALTTKKTPEQALREAKRSPAR